MPTLKRKTIRRQREKLHWDYGVEYEKIYPEFISELKAIRKAFKKGDIGIQKVKRYAYLVTALIQIRNGSRVGETIEAVQKFIIDDESRMTEVKVEKRRDVYYRKVVLPDEIQKSDIEFLRYAFAGKESKKLAQSYGQFLLNHFGFSTHALRYAWISYMSNHQSAQIIAKITGHKTMSLILHYTQKALAVVALVRMPKVTRQHRFSTA